MSKKTDALKRCAVALGYGNDVSEYTSDTVAGVLKEVAKNLECDSNDAKYHGITGRLNCIADNYKKTDDEKYNLRVKGEHCTVNVYDAYSYDEISAGVNVLEDTQYIAVKIVPDDGYVLGLCTINEINAVTDLVDDEYYSDEFYIHGNVDIVAKCFVETQTCKAKFNVVPDDATIEVTDYYGDTSYDVDENNTVNLPFYDYGYPYIATFNKTGYAESDMDIFVSAKDVLYQKTKEYDVELEENKTKLLIEVNGQGVYSYDNININIEDSEGNTIYGDYDASNRFYCNLPIGNYTYAASKHDYVTKTDESFTISEESITAGKYILEITLEEDTGGSDED